jgi:TonB family protein
VIRLVASDPKDAEAKLSAWKQAAVLSHPHLMPIFESGRAQVGGVELLYMVTEYAEESLAQVIPERPLSTGEAREMLEPILDVLTFLHGQGLVHSRIKPSNVMVVGDRLKLPLDTVRRAGAFARPASQLNVYDAPELTSGTILPASDIWSLGVTLVEALTQHPPAWDRSTRKDPAVPVEISEPFADFARACLHDDSARRSTLRDLRSKLNPSPSLEEPANEIDLPPSVEIGTNAPAHRQGSPFRGRVAAMVAAVVVVLAIVVFAFMHSYTPPPRPSPVQPHSPGSTAAPPSASQALPPTRSAGTIKAEVAERVMPDVSASANRTIHGKVEVSVRVDVDAGGAVSNARFQSRGSSRYFGAKALDAARKWRFKPAQRDGKAVPSAWLLRFQFRPSGPEVNAAQVSP